MAESNKWYNTNWTIGIVTGSILPVVVSLIIDAVKDKPLLSTFISIIYSIWVWLISLLNVEIKLWWLLTTLFAFIIITKIVRHYRVKEKDFTEYKSDTLKNWKWSWSWERNALNYKWNVVV